jgi:alpha-D-xyloside xylohydrolase
LNSLRLMNLAFGAAVLALLGSTNPSCAASYVQSFERNASGVTLYSESGALSVEVCSGSIIHVVASPMREIPEAIVPTVIHRCEDNEFKVLSDKSAITIRTPALQVIVDRASGNLRFLTSDGKTILSEPTGGGRKLSPVTIDGTPTFQVLQKFLSPPDEALYGLGQHQEGIFDIRSIPLHLLQANTNIVIPVLLSTKGYGLFWNNPSLTDYDVADEPVVLDPKTGEGSFKTSVSGEYGFLLMGNRRNRLQLSVGDKKIIDLKNMWIADSAGAKINLKADTEYKILAQTGGDTKLFVRHPSDTTDFHSEAGSAVDYFFFYGPGLEQVIQDYRLITGAAPLLPRWAYGFWQCRERYSSQQQILDTANEFRNRKIPVDVLVQDWQYWGKYGWNAMQFDEKYYPDPAQLMAGLHKQNLHMVISVWAKFGSETAVDQDMRKAKLVLTSAASTGEPGESKEKEHWADLFNPEAQSLYWSEIDRNLFRLGLDGWWLDASEPEGDPLATDKTFLGPGRIVRNAYPLYETSAVFDGQKSADPEKRVVILSRSSFAGQQRNSSISWSGDISGNWETLRQQIPAGLSFSMSGIPYWTTDIGGFFRTKDQYTSPDYHELLIRWFQYGAFCPIFRIHGYQSETELWKYGPRVEKVLRQYDELRYRLLPYIYSAAWGTTNRGEVPMRALPFVYPSDLSVRDVRDQFLFGDSLLVNPVTEPHATTREVVLPAGADWVDFWTGQTQRGGQTITVDAPIDQMPIFVKAGSIVPMGPVVQSAADAADPLEIRIYGGRNADFQLYEDSGDGYAYEKGAKATIHLHWDNNRNVLSIANRSGAFPGMSTKHNFRIVLVKQGHGTGAAESSAADRSVTYEGHQMIVDLGKQG